MARYRLTIEYDGTGYRGWQAQKNARSVQETLLTAARDLLGGDVDIQGAGRTDAGVHALGQVAHLECAAGMEIRRLREGLNDRLPAGINILRVEKAPPRFHARHHAVARSYLYIISKHRSAFGKRYIWWVRDRLAVPRMQEAAAAFRGFHDFSSFADKRLDKDASTKVLVHGVEVWEVGDLIAIRITASHFLWKMVRRMVGILVEVGRGALAPGDAALLLAGPSDLPSQYTAPPSGLFLERVFYEGEDPGAVRPSLPLPSTLPPFPSVRA